MPTDLDILRAANVLVRVHGEDAALEAGMRADSMLDKGDIESQRVWKRILEAVLELQRVEPVEGERTH